MEKKLENFLQTFKNVLTKKIDNDYIWMHLLASAAIKPGCGVSCFGRAIRRGANKDLGKLLHENWSDFIVFMAGKGEDFSKLEWQKITEMAIASKARVETWPSGIIDLYFGGGNLFAKLFATTNTEGISFKYIFKDVENCLLFEANRRRSSARAFRGHEAAKSVLDDFGFAIQEKKWLLQEITKSGCTKNDYSEIVLTNEKRWLAEALFRDVGLVDGLRHDMAVYIMEDPYISNSKELAIAEVDAIIIKIQCNLSALDKNKFRKSI